MNGAELLAAARESGATSTLSLSLKTGIPRSNLRRWIENEGVKFDIENVYSENAGLAPRWATSAPETAAPSNAESITRQGTAAGETIESKGESIRTLDDLIDAADVNLDEWSVKDYNVSTWESGDVTRYAVRAKLERKQEVLELDALKAATVAAMIEHAPPALPRPERTRSGLAMEIAVPDLHLGKLAHEEETGANYDGRIASHAFRTVFGQFVEQGARQGVERFIFAVGNDLLHVDGDENETTRGTRQDVDTRWYRSVKRAQALMVEAIDAMLAVADVTIVIVPGNHARIQEAMLGQIIGAWYRNEPRLEILDAPAPRQYYRFGKNLLGFTHGDGIKPAELPLLMATEAPEEWAATEHRVWSIGHTHSRKSDKFGSVAEYKGVEVRTSPSLSASDAWHVGKGYVGNLRAAEAYVHDYRAGEIARFRASIPADFE